MKTEYKGIDYGMGQSNIDKANGIRFGVIPRNALMAEALDDVFTHGRDLTYENYVQSLKDSLKQAIRSWFDENLYGDKTEVVFDAAWAEIEDQCIVSDQYDNNRESCYLYESNGYVVQTDSQGDVWVCKSPYYTKAQFCSPCAPGACYLLNPCPDGERAYCFGPDWFDENENPCPYSIWRVADDSLVFACPDDGKGGE